jgi:hypothetical protein
VGAGTSVTGPTSPPLVLSSPPLTAVFSASPEGTSPVGGASDPGIGDTCLGDKASEAPTGDGLPLVPLLPFPDLEKQIYIRGGVNLHTRFHGYKQPNIPSI